MNHQTEERTFKEPTIESVPKLAVDILAWMDYYHYSNKTPSNLFEYLKNNGYKEHDIPQWLKDEPEMKNLRKVPSRAARALIIYKALWHESI